MAWLALVATLSGCGGDVTEVVIIVAADTDVSDRAVSLAVRVYGADGTRIVDRIDALGTAVSFPARLPLAPRGGDASRTWRVEVDARTAFGCVFSAVMDSGGYEAGVASERTLTMTPTVPEACPFGPGCMGDCDDGVPCTVDSCVEDRCLNAVAEGQCAIEGACLTASAPNATDPCRVCTPDASRTAWSLAPGCDNAEIARFDDGAVAEARHGQSVAMRDNLIIVGAPLANTNTGQAFAYRLSDGAWKADGELVPRDVAPGAQFGEAVAVSGNWAIVGAPQVGEGRAYTFRRSATGWLPDQELTSSSLSELDHFGSAVAMDGDLAIVGATHVEAPIGESGAAWVFRRNAEDRWVEIAYVVPPDPQRSAFFGHSVALSGNRFVIGSVFHDPGGMGGAGAAHFFELSGDVVSPAIELVRPTVEAGTFFGDKVAIVGTRVAVAATQDNQFSNDGGAVYLFELSGGASELVGELGMGPAGGQAGLGLGMTSRYVAVGFPFNETGFVTLFRDTDGTYAALPRIEATDTIDSSFGRAIAAWDQWMVVGAPNVGDGGTVPGAIYIYELRP
jgi:hypothetical protein